jgi:hypothetical protein
MLLKITCQGLLKLPSSYVQFIYNTCISKNAANGEPIRMEGIHSNIKLLNNIFNNSGNGPAANFGDDVLFTEADHNVFYAKGNNQITYKGEKTLLEYQTASGLEQHSILADPDFFPGPKPKFMNSLLLPVAFPVVTITDDIEDKLRDASHPLVGAYESRPDTIFDFIHKELQVVSCNDTLFTGSNTVTVVLKHNSIPNINQFTVHKGSIDTIDIRYKTNLNTWVTEQWTGKLNIGQTLIYEFANKLTITKGKIYTLYIEAKVHGKSIDVNTSNDSVSSQINIPMGGEYTLGGNNPDFKDGEEGLKNLRVCHEYRLVKFNFRPGKYTMANIEGNDTLIVTSETKLVEDVKIVCNRIHASNLTFKTITIIPDNFPVATSYDGFGLEVFTKKLTIDSCYIDGFDGTSVFKNGFCFISSEHVTITNNYFINCKNSIIYNQIRNVNGTYGGWGAHHEISNNLFYGDRENAFIVQKQSLFTNYDIDPVDSIHFHHNTISALGGISLATSNKVFLQFYNNHIESYTSSLIIEDLPNEIVFYNNNFFSYATDESVKLIRTKAHQFINNSLMGSINLHSVKAVVLKNNSIYAREKAAFVMDNLSTYTGDYNNYYTNKSVLAQFIYPTDTINIKNMDSLKLATLQETHSISYNPYYHTSHSNSAFLKNKGMPISFIHTDIDDQPRNVTAPDIGADEIDLYTDVVWPGDANADSKVTGKDLLSIGLYDGTSGIARSFITTSWDGQPSVDWAQNQYNTTNMKHTDCNGDGKVDANDTTAIMDRFNLYHNTNRKVVNPSAVNTIGKDLFFVMKNPKTSYQLNDIVTVEIWFGKPVLPLYNAYGISFDVAVPSTAYISGTYNLTFHNSWLAKPHGSPSNAYNLSKISEQDGIAYGAMVRNDHLGVTGYGKIATLSFVSTGTAPNENIFLNFENVFAVDSKGNELVITPHNNSATNYKGDIVTGVTNETNSVDLFTITPNPFSENTTIHYSLSKNNFVKLEVFNSIGQLVEVLTEEIQNAGKHSVKFHSAHAGAYFVKLNLGDHVSIHKIIAY